MRDKQVDVVDTEFGPWRGTRLVDRKPVTVIEPPKAPEVGDPWCPLTVRARLHRIGWLLRKDPRVRPQQERSCMPKPLREMWKDLPGEPMRIPVPAADQDAVNQALSDLMRFWNDDEAKVVIYAIILKASGDDLAEQLGCSDTHARKQIKLMLDRLAVDWNKLPWRPDAKDVERAKKLIHRNIK